MKPLTPLQAIRQKCLDCVIYKPSEVRLCLADDCSLHPYRYATNPKRKGIGNKNNLKQKRSN